MAEKGSPAKDLGENEKNGRKPSGEEDEDDDVTTSEEQRPSGPILRSSLTKSPAKGSPKKGGASSPDSTSTEAGVPATKSPAKKAPAVAGPQFGSNLARENPNLVNLLTSSREDVPATPEANIPAATVPPSPSRAPKRGATGSDEATLDLPCSPTKKPKSPEKKNRN